MVFGMETQVRDGRAQSAARAGWIMGRFIGSGHFNISPTHALEVAHGRPGRPQRAAARAIAAIAAGAAERPL
ncbi:hypothetical protein [Burkholderia vietnamiensis]|jgi:hypothetical protein|uniref:hypothetical protein n=1 Tax=Burkholderia vietnamiensis TaxID=60552 RepID=UPI001590D711|nr:hypothetical protein [Burkholderia vietnamiensis]MCA8198659.1 hypothetical protein [Burkholderia vietnamiensis]